MITKESPVAKFSGSLVLGDFLTFPQLHLWEQALNEVKKLGDEATVGQLYSTLLPPALAIVKEWHLAGLDEKLTVNNFPANAKLTAWVIECVTELYSHTNASDPN